MHSTAHGSQPSPLMYPIRGARTLDNVTRRSRSTVPSNCRTGPFPVDDDGNDVNDKDDDDGVTGVPTAPTSSPPPQPPPRASQMKSRFAWASRSASRNANAVSLVTEPTKRSCTRASPTLTISTAMLPLGGVQHRAQHVDPAVQGLEQHPPPRGSSGAAR